MAPPSEVDVIVIGGGAAGCVVAGRLAKADPNLQVAILEAGQDNLDYPTSIQPAMFISHLAPTSTTATFYLSKESKDVAGRACVVPMGGMLGGGSSINFMMYTRGSASDYDDWKMEGWGFEDILPLARKIETMTIKEGQDPAVHGSSGPLEVSYGGHQSHLGEEFLDVTKDLYDVPYTKDLQDFKTGHGCTTWPKWISPKTGRRQDAAHGYVHPLVKSQTNLHVVTEQKTIRVIFEGTKAVAVEYCQNPNAKVPINPEQPPTVGAIKTMKARKMIVCCAGALGTPMILERSGVGAKEILEPLSIPVVSDVPGVGREYQDHQLTLATYSVSPESDTLDDYLRGDPEVHAKVGPQWTETGKGLIATNTIDSGMKARPTEEELAEMGPDFKKIWDQYFKDAPDKPVMFGGLLASFLGDHSLLPPGKYMMMGAYLCYPFSLGQIHITSKDPFAPADFQAGFLSHPADMAPQVWMYKKLREIARRMPSYRGELAPVHPKFAEDSPARCVAYEDQKGKKVENIVYSEQDNKVIEEWMRENVGTTWHSMSTCPMKPKEAGGVVDARLNVYGTQNLKLCDLSICPANVGSNTYSVALTVGEKGAVLVGEDLGIKGV